MLKFLFCEEVMGGIKSGYYYFFDFNRLGYIIIFLFRVDVYRIIVWLLLLFGRRNLNFVIFNIIRNIMLFFFIFMF